MALVLVAMTVSAGTNAAKSVNKSGINWNPVMDAIIQVESEGNPNAVSGNSVGAMQITPILVKDCNEILKKQKSKKRYTMADRYSVAKSKEMFLLIQSHYNPENSIEKAIRSWNGGVRYSVRATNRYYQKVMANLK
ncbi:MAG: transglycosylase SLT domain-containing protein [Bacteroidaceae bacterium]|nr:transglycosylase SLT domain-containing protein [Bacteroidaceae bacterium]